MDFQLSQNLRQLRMMVIQILMEKYDYTLETAMEILYNSDTFARLQDVKTGLYYQSPGYVYSFLANEIHFCDYRR